MRTNEMEDSEIKSDFVEEGGGMRKNEDGERIRRGK
jgi:hypothetical protein